MTTFPFLLCWCKRSRVSKACNRGASRLGEAWARPRLGRKTYWHKDKARLMGTRNYIILLLKSQQGWTWNSWCLCCLARILSRSWRKGTASRQASRLQGDGNCSKPKKNIGETKLEAGLNASLELQCRETMEIRTKHVRAGFEAGLEGLKAMEIGAKQYDKEGTLFWTSKRKKKSSAQKWASPVQDSSRSWYRSNQLQFEISASTNLPQWRGQKGTKTGPSRGDHFWFQAGPLSDPFWNTFLLHGGPKLDPQQVESGASLKVRF